jgi:hypothetical protein
MTRWTVTAAESIRTIYVMARIGAPGRLARQPGEQARDHGLIEYLAAEDEQAGTRRGNCSVKDARGEIA